MPSPSSPATRTRRAPFLRALSFALISLVVAVHGAHAQTAASASVSADVQQPITVAKTNDLAFGTLFPGLSKTVAVTDVGAAAFAIQGQAGGNVNITFVLPSTISSGSSTLAISNWTARHASVNSPIAGIDFLPSTGGTSATIGTAGFRYIFVGATAQPTASQAAGSYSGTATMTVVYF